MHAHPHTLSSNVSTAIWALEKNILTIPMNQKNHQTRKYENSLTNFEKCVNKNEETEVDASQCTCVAFITDDDTKGLNVRKQGNKTAEILTVIPQQLDGTNVMITGTSNNGWVLISKANDANGVNILKSKGYVFGQKLGVSISAYDKRKAMLYFEPNIKANLSRLCHQNHPYLL
ncbi:MAG: SH3 domain-containing protein [Saprospiraceae bacterium]|nr:SH3 domain-containing protein [Saprospiraceae bacterium]